MTARTRHNLAFVAPMLSPSDTIDLSASLALPAPIFAMPFAEATDGAIRVDTNEPLCMLDTGAGVDASNGVHGECPNSRRTNTLAVSTANGLVVPPFKNDYVIMTRNRRGSKANIVRRNAVVLENCPHTLVSGGKMALEDGVGTWLAPYDQVSYLRPQANDHSLDVPLFNVGVLVIPARSVTADAYAAVTTGAVQHGRGTGRTSGKLAHATFNHRPLDVLRKMPKYTNAPESWSTVQAPV